MIPDDIHLEIGSLLYHGLDQIDLTGPFEVFSRIPNSTYRLFAKSNEPVKDIRGLRITPDAVLADAPRLDLLHIPGGFGQEALMDDEEVLERANRSLRDITVKREQTARRVAARLGIIPPALTPNQRHESR